VFFHIDDAVRLQKDVEFVARGGFPEGGYEKTAVLRKQRHKTPPKKIRLSLRTLRMLRVLYGKILQLGA
jgi:hypothetical protein